MQVAAVSRPSARRLWFFGGIILALSLHMLQLALKPFVQPALAYVGLTQWLYLLPAALIARHLGRRWLMRGLLAGGALTALVNGAAWAVVYYIYFMPHA